MEQEFALRGGGIHLLGERAECNPAFLQLVYRRKQMGQRSPKTVELPHHQAIARLEECQRRRKAGTIVAAAARAIFKQMPLIDPCGQQGVALQIQDLAIAVGRNAHVADEHAYGNPGLIGFRTLCHSDRGCRACFEAEIGH